MDRGPTVNQPCLKLTTYFGERQRDGCAKAAAATGDDGDFVVESEFVQDHGRHRNKAWLVAEPYF